MEQLDWQEAPAPEAAQGEDCEAGGQPEEVTPPPAEEPGAASAGPQEPTGYARTLDTPGPALERELEAIRALDPDVRGFADLPRMASFPKFIGLAQKGYSFLDAFRAANFEAIVERQAKAARQAAMNELRSTRHLEPVGGEAEPASDLTQDEMDWWKAFGFSEKKARYYHNKYKKER